MLDEFLPIEGDEEVAMQKLLDYLRPSIEQAERGEFSERSVMDIAHDVSL